MNQAPAYQMYAGDWLKSRSVRMMKDYQRGWYIQLLNEAWEGKPQCMLPKNRNTLQVLAGVSDLARDQPQFADEWDVVEAMFVPDGDYVYNERQLEELAKQKQKRISARKAGLESAKRRERARKELQRLKKEHLAQGNGRSTDVQREGNEDPTLHTSTSTPSSTSSSSSSNTPQAPPGGEARPDRGTNHKAWNLEDFREECKQANEPQVLYPDELEDFIEYWTEPTERGEFKLALNQTWSTRRRMHTAVKMVYGGRRREKPIPGSELPKFDGWDEDGKTRISFEDWKVKHGVK